MCYAIAIYSIAQAGGFVNIIYGGRILKTLYGGGSSSYVLTLPVGTTTTISYYTGQLSRPDSSLSFTLQPVTIPPYQLVSGQTYNLQKEQQGNTLIV
jgi:hypothetical protein